MNTRMLAHVGTRRGAYRGGCDANSFLGMDTKEMSRGARVGASLSVLVPVVLSGLFLVAFFPQVWWILTIYGWIVFPASGLLMSGLAEAARDPGRTAPVSTAVSKERELLGALRDHGELSPVMAASETSLTVEEADRMLQRLAKDGHLEVKVGGGGLFYSFWAANDEGTRVRREIESE